MAALSVDLQVLPQLANGQANTFWVIPSEVTSALQGVSRAFTAAVPRSPATRDGSPSAAPAARAAEDAAQAAEAAAEAVADAGFHQITNGTTGRATVAADVRRNAPAADPGVSS